jgi:hypothetical protein
MFRRKPRHVDVVFVSDGVSEDAWPTERFDIDPKTGKLWVWVDHSDIDRPAVMKVTNGHPAHEKRTQWR